MRLRSLKQWHTEPMGVGAVIIRVRERVLQHDVPPNIPHATVRCKMPKVMILWTQIMTTKKNAPKKKRKAASLLMLERREIGAAEFKARCLEIMDEVERLGVEVVITKHRRPVARLVPVEKEQGFVGSMRGAVIWAGDLISPTGEVWEADESNFT